MVELMGGKEAVLEDLINFFENVPEDKRWNEHIIMPMNLYILYLTYLISWVSLVNTEVTLEICKRAYHNGVNGLVGNDVGQMSAWYVLSAIGLHQACPGVFVMKLQVLFLMK